MQIPFYDEYLPLVSLTQDQQAQTFKDNIIRQQLNEGYIYKFFQFNNDENLNLEKINSVKSQRLWASFYTGFSDKTELQIQCNWKKVARHTGWSVEQLQFFQNTYKESQQISCFTYTISDFMWREYANNGNGFCLQFTLDNADMFFPIVYLNKSKIDFTDDLILAIKKTDLTSVRKLALLPPFLKRIKYKDENELRFFCGDDYDNENGIMGGRVFAGKAEKMGVRGIYYDYSHAGISLKKIFIGDNCSLNHREQLNRILV